MGLINEKPVQKVIAAHMESGKALAVILAGHNGSGKSTLWTAQLSEHFQIPLINADRMMMSILPDTSNGEILPDWARNIRDTDESWMKVARNGVEAFIAQAMAAKVPFAFETVYSYRETTKEGDLKTKTDKIRELQNAGYFVVLVFVGLGSWELSALRVTTRVAQGGHAVPTDKLQARFPRTQESIREASQIADATIMTDNSRATEYAFTLCRVQLKNTVEFDIRNRPGHQVAAINEWMNKVCPN